MKKIFQTFCASTLVSVSVFAASPAKAEEVYMIRGFLNVFSDGMNQMTNKMRRKGIRARALSVGGWEGAAKDIVVRSKNKKVSYPIVIAGHSLGGIDAVRFANYLGSAGVPVELVIGLDPGFPQPVPFTKGAKKVINYKIPSGQSYRKGKGFKGTIKHIDVSKYGTDHVGIDKHQKVQSLVMSNIRKVVAK